MEEAQAVVTLTYKNGEDCIPAGFHSEDTLWQMVSDIMATMKLEQPGTLVLREPYGLHRHDEVAAFHWGGFTAPPDALPMGFVK